MYRWINFATGYTGMSILLIFHQIQLPPAFNIENGGTINDADGNKIEDVSFDFDIPDSTRKGLYKLELYCHDKAGNVGSNQVLVGFKD